MSLLHQVFLHILKFMLQKPEFGSDQNSSNICRYSSFLKQNNLIAFIFCTTKGGETQIWSNDQNTGLWQLVTESTRIVAFLECSAKSVVFLFVARNLEHCTHRCMSIAIFHVSSGNNASLMCRIEVSLLSKTALSLFCLWKLFLAVWLTVCVPLKTKKCSCFLLLGSKRYKDAKETLWAALHQKNQPKRYLGEHLVCLILVIFG